MCVVGIHEQRFAICRGRRGRAAQRQQYIAQVVVRLRIVEPEGECLSIRRRGRFQLSGCLQCIAKVVMRLRQIRVPRQGTATSGSRLVKATLAREHHS